MAFGMPYYNAGFDAGSGAGTAVGGAAGAAAGAAGAGSGGFGWGQALGYGAMGAGALYGLFGGGGGGSNVNPDPYGIGQQMSAESSRLWGMYNKGEITPAEQAQIGQYEQQQSQAVKDYYHKAGLADSSMAQEALGQVKQHANLMRLQANQSLLQPAIQASGLATEYANQLYQYNLMQDQEKQQAMQNFMGTVGTVAGMVLA